MAAERIKRKVQRPIKITALSLQTAHPCSFPYGSIYGPVPACRLYLETSKLTSMGRQLSFTMTCDKLALTNTPCQMHAHLPGNAGPAPAKAQLYFEGAPGPMQVQEVLTAADGTRSVLSRAAGQKRCAWVPLHFA